MSVSSSGQGPTDLSLHCYRRHGVDHQGSGVAGSPFTKKRPEGPPLGNSANLTGVTAPSSAVIVPVLRFISVLAYPGQTELMQKSGNSGFYLQHDF
ncbi:hypothetical protein F383_26058 [Gossypium arboreum]|uniref:Uncharacterized protein n=1 Tax=Gossypium arboreum TaxID=29729 RepID=A0A0B0P5F7_GOSAR|nr:hypothetical protein F383_26058 [Gossypium arboreum]